MHSCFVTPPNGTSISKQLNLNDQESHGFVASKNPNKPHRPGNLHLVRVQEIQKVVTFRAMWNVLSEFVEWYLWIRKVIKPCLTLGLVQSGSRR